MVTYASPRPALQRKKLEKSTSSILTKKLTNKTNGIEYYTFSFTRI